MVRLTLLRDWNRQRPCAFSCAVGANVEPNELIVERLQHAVTHAIERYNLLVHELPHSRGETGYFIPFPLNTCVPCSKAQGKTLGLRRRLHSYFSDLVSPLF